MRTVLDIDGVLYKFSKTAQYMIARRLGLENREDLEWDDSTWDCGRPKEDWDWVLSYPQTEWVFRHGHLWSGAIEFAYDLAKLSEVALVTKRPSHATKVTMDWIRYNFDHEPFPFAEVHILGDDRKKSEIPADVYIDDSLENVQDLVDNTMATVLLVDRPWNQDWLDGIPGVLRTHSFNDILEAVQWQKESSKKPTVSSTATEASPTDIQQTTLSEWEGFGAASLESPMFRPGSLHSASSDSRSAEKPTSQSETTELISQATQRHYR